MDGVIHRIESHFQVVGSVCRIVSNSSLEFLTKVLFVLCTSECGVLYAVRNTDHAISTCIEYHFSSADRISPNHALRVLISRKYLLCGECNAVLCSTVTYHHICNIPCLFGYNCIPRYRAGCRNRILNSVVDRYGQSHMYFVCSHLFFHLLGRFSLLPFPPSWLP